MCTSDPLTRRCMYSFTPIHSPFPLCMHVPIYSIYEYSYSIALASCGEHAAMSAGNGMGNGTMSSVRLQVCFNFVHHLLHRS
jgi:hypothetical protein